MDKHAGIRYQCEFCTKSFAKTQDRDNHMSVHTGIWLMKCDSCGKGFNEKRLYERHIKCHPQQTVKFLSKYIAEVRNLYFNTFKARVNFTFLEKKSSRPSSHACMRNFLSCLISIQVFIQDNFCVLLLKSSKRDTSFRSYLLFQGRESCKFGEMVNRDVKIYLDQRCLFSLVAINSTTQRGSQQTHAKPNGKFKQYCELWKNGHNIKTNYEIHVDKHACVRYQCELCEKMFAKTQDRDNYMSVHTGVWRMQCDECVKRFSERRLYERRYKIHSQRR